MMRHTAVAYHSGAMPNGLPTKNQPAATMPPPIIDQNAARLLTLGHARAARRTTPTTERIWNAPSIWLRIVWPSYVKYKGYILKKSSSLSPMSMNDVAERMGVHVSTNQPGCKGKYADFDGNIIAIKDMFSLKASRQDQDAKSADMIKKFIQRQIAQEDKRSPLSDQQLQQPCGKRRQYIAPSGRENTERGLASQAPCAEKTV